MTPDPIRQAAITAAQMERGCSPVRRNVGERCGPLVCNSHGCEWADSGCLVSADVADSVLAAVTEPLMRAGGERELRAAADAILVMAQRTTYAKAEFVVDVPQASDVLTGSHGGLNLALREVNARVDRLAEEQP